jgi:hypothetical protein
MYIYTYVYKGRPIHLECNVHYIQFICHLMLAGSDTTDIQLGVKKELVPETKANMLA